MLTIAHQKLAHVYQLAREADRRVLTLDGEPVAILRGGGTYAVGSRWRAREAWVASRPDGRPLGMLGSKLAAYAEAIAAAAALEREAQR